jgi:hypothetical protein
LKSASDSKRSGVGGWFRKRKLKPKEKVKKERTAEPATLRILAFALTLVSMGLGLSLMPLFPQPLPILLAFLVAFVTFKSPRFGMPVGTLLIGLGVLYHLATIDFIAMLGEPMVRQGFIAVFMVVFIIIPIIFRRYKDAIAIDLGIMAAILLFFNQTYYLAIPLILTSAVLFKRSSIFTIVYYALISAPFQMMQYLSFIRQINQVDWWITPGSSPTVFVPLSGILKDIQQAMLQFRLFDTSQVMNAIVGQINATPAPAVRTLGTVLTQYLDSFPGIVLFLVIVVGGVFAFSFVARSFVKNSAPEMENLLPVITAATATVLFFVLAGALQGALAFRAEIDAVKVLIATFAAAVLTVPSAFINYSPKQSATVEMILGKARELMTKLQVFEDSLNKVKSTIPVVVSSTEGKMLVIKDKLNDTLSKSSDRFYSSSDLDGKFGELDILSAEIDKLFLELDITLGEYQVFTNCEYSSWTGKLRAMGLEIKTAAKLDFQRDLPLDMRIDSIKEVIDGGRLVANEVTPVVGQIYSIIRSLYDPSLPEESQTLTFAKQKLSENVAPWIVVEALFTALNAWKKQYGAQISRSVENLRNSLTPIANLGSQSEQLLPVLGDNLPKMMDLAKKAEDIKAGIETKPLNVVNVMTINDIFQSSLSVSKDVLSILYEELKTKEETIDNLLPTKDYLWDRNITLKQQMKIAMEIMFDSSKYKLNQVMENLPVSLSYIDECVRTIAAYNDKKEFLLNYPLAEIAIEDALKQKKRISAKDLPFDAKYAEEYLRLFYSQRFSEFSFDDTSMLLMRKA